MLVQQRGQHGVVLSRVLYPNDAEEGEAVLAGTEHLLHGQVQLSSS